MNRLFLIGVVLLSSASMVALISAESALAQCEGGGMMGMCMGGEECHEPEEICGEENCPSGGMIGGCMTGEECFTGMMENCHESGGGSMGCHMEEECEEMFEFCEESMHERCSETHEFCEEMIRHRGGHHHMEMQLHGKPNPFNPFTSLNFSLPEASQVDLTVFDIKGQQVASLASGHFEAGSHSITFSGQHLPSGVYFAKMEALGTVTTTKLMLVK